MIDLRTGKKCGGGGEGGEGPRRMSSSAESLEEATDIIYPSLSLATTSIL